MPSSSIQLPQTSRGEERKVPILQGNVLDIDHQTILPGNFDSKSNRIIHPILPDNSRFIILNQDNGSVASYDFSIFPGFMKKSANLEDWIGKENLPNVKIENVPGKGIPVVKISWGSKNHIIYHPSRNEFILYGNDHAVRVR